MDDVERSDSVRSRAWRWWVVTAVVLAGLCIAFVTLALDVDQTTVAITPAQRQTPSAQSLMDQPRMTAKPRMTAQPRRNQPQMTAEPVTPEQLSIPAIGVTTELVSLGLNTDRTVEVPRGPGRAGWFNQGPTPGQSGSSVILGHVDSVDGPAVFFRLRYLEQGDLVRVRLSDATVAHFEVMRVATYANEVFPAEQVYAGAIRHQALNLVTCGGEYDADAGGYQSNVVVYTRHLRTTAGEA